MTQPTLLKLAPIAALASLIATWQVHQRAGDETFLCDGIECSLGSSTSWLLTGATLIGPFVALGGFFWSRSLHYRERLGPFSDRAIPDSEEILEVLAVLLAALISYWLLLNGPSIEAVDIDKPNTWAQSLREFRASDNPTAQQRQSLKEVPTRLTWFVIGVLASAPFMFSLGSMLGREWYGRKRRRAQELGDDTQSMGVSEGMGRATGIDLTEVELNQSSHEDGAR